MKKILALLLALIMVVGLVACGKTEQPAGNQPSGDTGAIEGTYTIRLCTATGGKHQQNATMEEFKTRIEAASNGAITVELYPASQLGTAPQMIDGVQNGDIEGIMLPSSYFASYAPAIAILDLPFLFAADGTAAAQAQKILAAGTSLDEYLYDYGFVAGGYLLGGNSYLLTTFPIESMSDLKGNTLWTLPSPTLQAALGAWGASPAAMDPSDVAVNLQNGAIKGVLNDCTFWLVQGLYESAKCINLCPGGAFVNCFFFSADWIDSLPQNVKDLVLTTAKTVVEEFEVPYMTAMSESAMKTMIDAGCVVYEPSAELLEEMKAATASLHDEYKAKNADCAAMYEEFVGLIAASK